MNLNKNEVGKVENHVSTKWLSFGKCLEKILIQLVLMQF